MVRGKVKLLKQPVLPVLIRWPAITLLIFFNLSVVVAQRNSLVHDGLKRTFNIHAPEVYDHPGKFPLVIALHGRGGNGKSMILITRKGFNRMSDRDGFVVVYPDGIERNWNDGREDQEADDRAHRENIDDIGFISSLIDLMIGDFNIDPKRIYITGISNGAIMAYRLACELSHKITAIAPVDGNIPVRLINKCSPSEPVSVLAVNNVNDPLVPFDGGEIFGNFHRVKLGKVLSVRESVEFWADRNMCLIRNRVTKEPDRDPGDGTTVIRTDNLNGLKGTEVILYSINGGGHTWPGGFQYLPVSVIGKTCRDIDANELIWSFFKRLTKY